MPPIPLSEPQLNILHLEHDGENAQSLGQELRSKSVPLQAWPSRRGLPETQRDCEACAAELAEYLLG